MDKNSVYNQITAALKEYPELPYTFQDVGSAGKLDVIFSLWKDDIGFKEKFFYVYHLIEKIQEAMEVGFVPENTKAWIKNNAPLIAYHTLFNDRLRLMLREGKMDEKALYPIGLELATKGHTGEEVKLGMLILGHFKNDLARRILRTLGLHSEFTLFAIEASKNFKDHNSFVFYLAKNTTGYGKLASIALLEPITEEQRDWMLTEGAINEVARDLSAVICLDKEDMAFYYQDFEVSKTNYGYFSRLLAYGGQKGFIRAFPGSLNIVNGYLNEVMGEINSFIELAAVVMIWINLGSSWEEFNEEYKTHDWTREINNDIKDQCNGILKSAKWDNLILRELENPTESTRLILTVMDRLNFLPWLNKLVPLLDRDLFDLDIMTFTLIEHPRFYAGVILEYLKALLPKEVFSGPMDIKKEEYTSEYKPDIWLVHLLKAMISEGEYLEQFM
ncbi:MAG: hypothetical protein GX352_07900, partial [Clostridiales bacterium]|nr:hypothetical protein [Clostridiales bacterium]